MKTTKDKFLKKHQAKIKKEESRKKRVSKTSLIETSPFIRRKIRDAHTKFLLQQVDSGFFSPRWYIVFLLKEKDERLHEDDWVKDITHIRNMFYQEYYQGDRDWKNKIDRPKTIWGLEFGKTGTNPHINLLVEKTRREWDESFLTRLFNEDLPKQVKCMKSEDSATVTDFKTSGLHGYINKEATWEFSPIIYSISDYEKHPKTQSTNHQLSKQWKNYGHKP